MSQVIFPLSASYYEAAEKEERKKKKNNNPTWQLMCCCLSPIVGSQQYEHIDSNNWGISKGRRSPETAGPHWHGGHSPEDNPQGQLKFQLWVPKQLRSSPAFPTGGAGNVLHWNGTFSWHFTFPICSLHPLSSHCVSALAWLLGTWCRGIKNSKF